MTKSNSQSFTKAELFAAKRAARKGNFSGEDSAVEPEFNSTPDTGNGPLIWQGELPEQEEQEEKFNSEQFARRVAKAVGAGAVNETISDELPRRVK